MEHLEMEICLKIIHPKKITVHFMISECALATLVGRCQSVGTSHFFQMSKGGP